MALESEIRNWLRALSASTEWALSSASRTDNWLPYNPIMAGGPYGMVYLGNDARNYDNHMMGITLAYTFP